MPLLPPCRRSQPVTASIVSRTDKGMVECSCSIVITRVLYQNKRRKTPAIPGTTGVPALLNRPVSVMLLAKRTQAEHFS